MTLYLTGKSSAGKRQLATGKSGNGAAAAVQTDRPFDGGFAAGRIDPCYSRE